MMWGAIGFWITALVTGLAVKTPAAEMNKAAVELVKTGKVDVARASWWGFDPNDATECLQTAIDSGVKTLVVDNVGSPWIVKPIKLTSNQKIIFEPGVEVVAKAGEFKGTGDSLFSATNEENIELIGYGATFRMRRDEYAAPPYKKGEWRMALASRSCRNVKIYGLTMAESGGDGIYLGVAKKGVPNQNIHIKDVVCDKNYRQGISVISAENLLIENVRMTNTAGTAPQSGIDLEPNHGDEILANITIRNCTTQANNGFGYQFHLTALKASSRPISIRVENSRSIGDKAGSVQITTGRTIQDAVKGTIEFAGCEFDRAGNQGIGVDGNPGGACTIRFIDCVVENAGLCKPEVSPVVVSGNGQGIEFQNLILRDPLKRSPIKHVRLEQGGPANAVRGTIIVQDAQAYKTITMPPSNR
jgi:hypothetical protein